MTGCDSILDYMVRRLVAGKLFADHKAMNAVGSALGYDHQQIYVRLNGQEVHIAEKIANDNLCGASEQRIRREISTQTRVMQRQEQRRQERIYKGRSPGAGAGGYNRDLSSIEHRIDDARVKIDILNGELVRRRGSDHQRS